MAGLAGRLMPESDLTEKLLTNDLPEEILVMEPDRIDTSILFKEALEKYQNTYMHFKMKKGPVDCKISTLKQARKFLDTYIPNGSF